MIRTLTPNRAMIFAIAAFVAYWLAALIVPPVYLRDIFNSLAFGAAVMITLTWMPAAFRALRENAHTGEWQLILAVFIVWFVVMCQRVYVIIFNSLGRPESWAESPIAGFWPYSYMIAGLLFLSAPGVREDRIGSRSIWAIVTAVALGSLLAGVLIGASISTAS